MFPVEIRDILRSIAAQGNQIPIDARANSCALEEHGPFELQEEGLQFLSGTTGDARQLVAAAHGPVTWQDDRDGACTAGVAKSLGNSADVGCQLTASVGLAIWNVRHDFPDAAPKVGAGRRYW